MSGSDDGTWYVLICRQCGDGDLPMPFLSAAERGKWAAGHTKATSHDKWLVIDQPDVNFAKWAAGPIAPMN